MRGVLFGMTAAGAVLCFAGNAHAVLASMCSETQTQCERADVAVTKLEEGPNDFDYDTGWVPSNSPIQIRIVVALHDRTQVDLAGTLDSTWPDPITLTPTGTLQQGHISIDDGFEVSIQARFTVTVGGQTYSWTGNVPYLPNVNFLASATQTFDPWAWTGGDPKLSTVSVETATQKIAQVDLVSLITSIPGISGGFELDGAATYSAWYDTLRIDFDETNGVSPIPNVDPTHADTRLLISEAPSFDTNVFIHGEVTHQVTLHFIPSFYFDILGDDFTLPIADLPLALPASAPAAWDFDPVPVHVPLPELSIPNANIDVGNIPVGVGTDEYVKITNVGEEMLIGTVDTLAPMAEIDTPDFSVTPQQSAGLKLLFVPTAPGPFDVLLHLGSNDPLTPNAFVHLTGTAGATDISETGGCGCGVAHMRSRDALFALALGLVAIARRRNRQRAIATRARL